MRKEIAKMAFFLQGIVILIMVMMIVCNNDNVEKVCNYLWKCSAFSLCAILITSRVRENCCIKTIPCMIQNA